MNELSKHEKKKFAKLTAQRTCYELSKDEVLIDVVGGAAEGLQWAGVSVILQSGKDGNEVYTRAAKALATVLPCQVLAQAMKISESMKEEGNKPFADFSSNWIERMTRLLADGTAEDALLW